MSKSTVAAIATPLGNGGIGVIRLSGDDAITIADKIFKSRSGKLLADLPGYSALFGNSVIGEEIIDQTVATVFRAPKSYTGENVVELSVHGGTLILKKILRALFDNGATPAIEGEFSKRAFMNGKLDLTQAESIMGLISAHSESQLKMASGSLQGRVSQKIENISGALVNLGAHIAVFSDYPDEELPELQPKNFERKMHDIINELENILSTYDAGRILREGITTAIVGKPNVGKSTLMNMLSGTDRSIVTSVAGTTRDIIEETVTVGEITLRLADTAGIHSTDDTVEKLGVDLAKKRIDTSELILAVFDSSSVLDSDDLSLIDDIKDKKAVIVVNKSDLGSRIDLTLFKDLPLVNISAKTGEGYDALSDAITKITAVANLNPDAAVLSSERQRACAARALDSVRFALSTMNSGMSIDAVGVCLDDAVAALLELTGKRVTNEVADEVFRHFCVGK